MTLRVLNLLKVEKVMCCFERTFPDFKHNLWIFLPQKLINIHENKQDQRKSSDIQNIRIIEVQMIEVWLCHLGKNVRVALPFFNKQQEFYTALPQFCM